MVHLTCRLSTKAFTSLAFIFQVDVPALGLSLCVLDCECEDSLSLLDCRFSLFVVGLKS